MIVIGERINGMFKDVKQAITEKDKNAIIDLAKKEIAAGANMLDINVGPAAADELGAMEWLVETVQDAVDIPLAIDSSKPKTVEAGLKICKNKALINSTTGEKAKLEILIGLAKDNDADILGLTMDEKGIPSTTAARTEIGLKILAAAMEAGLETDRVHLDPVVLPVRFAQDQCPTMLETIRELKMLADPAPKIVVGLSNISQGTKQRPLINRIYMVMAIACGLDEAIVDPFDTELIDAMITAELLLNKQIYSESFLKAYKSSL